MCKGGRGGFPETPRFERLPLRTARLTGWPPGRTAPPDRHNLLSCLQIEPDRQNDGSRGRRRSDTDENQQGRRSGSWSGSGPESDQIG